MNEYLDEVLDEFINQFGTRLTESLEEFFKVAGCSKKELADKIGVSASDINAIMEGDVALLDFATVMRIAIAVGVPIICGKIDSKEIKAMVDRMAPKEDYTHKPNDRQQPRRMRRPDFDSMDRDKLVKIIMRHLWDDEIDTESATLDQLVKFLKEKDEKIMARLKPESLRGPLPKFPPRMDMMDGAKAELDRFVKNMSRNPFQRV